MIESEFVTTLRRAIALVERLNIPYHLTGGLASSYYGEPRLTQDIDLVVAFELKHVEAFVAECATQYLLSKDSIVEAIQDEGMFQALDNETFIKIDFHVGELVPGELTRSQPRELLEGLQVNLVSKSDAILSKLIWFQQGSGKSREDLVAMLADPEPVDMTVLRALAHSLNVDNLLAEILAESDAH